MTFKTQRCVPWALAASLLASPSFGQTPAPADLVPPSIAYGELYRAVELAGVFPDSKTFPDMVPDAAPSALRKQYLDQRRRPGFDLAAFVHGHFTGPTPAGPTVDRAMAGEHLLAYVKRLWPALRQEQTQVPPFSTLQTLPHAYVVPGGRFREVYYWDTYFTMLGLEGDGQDDLALDMLANFAVEIDRYGMIPNGNRSYYLSRSQPPFFSLMVELLAERDGDDIYARYLPQMVREWEYWMAGAASASIGAPSRNVVTLPDGVMLNRYWDARAAPRDESFKEDVATAETSNRAHALVWRNLRAGAESGWDFSSRWLADGKTLATIRTLSVVPIDLNTLLVHLERTIAQAYEKSGQAEQAANFARRADRRAAAIRTLMWDEDAGMFADYLLDEHRRSPALTAATLYPLFMGVASPAEARAVAATVRTKLLDVGGLATTLTVSGQQWDAPNGWAPLQWIAVQGLRRNGEADLAEEIATRWVRKTIAGYRQSAKLVEKYNVTTISGDAGSGGEYATQIGFGWTNGVLVGLTGLYPALQSEAAAATPD